VTSAFKVAEAGGHLDGVQGGGQHVLDHALVLVVDERRGAVEEAAVHQREHDNARRHELHEGEVTAGLALAAQGEHEDRQEQEAGDDRPADRLDAVFPVAPEVSVDQSPHARRSR
jgi:hypothetical protein